MWIETVPHGCQAGQRRFIRQQWRMWIETPASSHALIDSWPSFASNGECGLKLAFTDPRHHAREFIRQQWRMWIETAFARRMW